MKRLLSHFLLAILFLSSFALSSNLDAAEVGTEGQIVADKIASISNKAIYNLDTDQLAAVLENFLDEKPEIKALTITESIDQERLLTYFRQHDKAVYNQPIPDDLLKLKHFSAVSMFDGEQIGTVVVYYTASSTIDLNADELAWIAANPIVSVGIEEWFPFVRTEKDGTPGGIAGDFIAQVQEQTGLKFKVISDEWSTLLADFEAGKIDLLPATYFTDERATYGLYSNAYFSAKEFLYVKQDDDSIRSFDDLDGKKLAIVRGFGTIPKIREKFPGIEIVETQNQLASIYAVLNGEVNALYESQIVIDDLVRSELITGLKGIAENTFSASQLYFFSRLDEPLLQSILTKALDNISEAKRRELISKWVTAQDGVGKTDQMVLPERTAFNQADFIIQYIAIVFAVMLAIIFATWLARGRPKQLTIRETLFAVFFVFAGLIVSIGTLVTMLLEAEQEQSKVEVKNKASFNLALELKQSSDNLTRFARSFSATGDPMYKNYYQAIIAIRDGKRAHPKEYSHSYWDQVAAGNVTVDEDGELYSIEQKILDLGFSEDEQKKLSQAKTESDALVKLETASMNAVLGRFQDANGAFSVEGEPDLEMARQLLYGKEYLDAKAKIKKPIDDFFILLEWRTTHELNVLREQNKAIILAITLLTIITIGFAFYAFFLLKRRIISPLSLLEAGALTLKDGNYSSRVDVAFNDEIGTLAQSFNLMARGIEERTQEVERKSTLLKAVLSSINQGLVAYDENLKLIISNKRFQEIRGVPDALAQPGSSFADWVKFDAERGEFEGNSQKLSVRDQIHRAKQFLSHSFERTRPDGTILDVVGGPLPTGGFVSTFTDITERKLAEQKLSNAFEIIRGSINYAARIQRAMLPDASILAAVTQDHFVLWEPRDVVGGDIHWHGAWGDGCLIILGDCTGHGVPGAFMTLISVGNLERAMSGVEGGNLGELVARMHQHIQVSLGQHYGEGDSDDGIELGACYFVPEEPRMTFVGARFELIINDGNDISVVKGTKKGMGYRGIPYEQAYEAKTIDLKPGQSFYLTTDGLIDQVGGERKRMFGKKRFKELLASVQDMPMSEQKLIIRQALLDFQGDENRRDDVSVIGFKF